MYAHRCLLCVCVCSPPVAIRDLAEVLNGTEALTEMQCFPGPLTRDVPKEAVMTYLQQKAKVCSSHNHGERGREYTAHLQTLYFCCFISLVHCRNTIPIRCFGIF